MESGLRRVHEQGNTIGTFWKQKNKLIFANRKIIRVLQSSYLGDTKI